MNLKFVMNKLTLFFSFSLLFGCGCIFLVDNYLSFGFSILLPVLVVINFILLIFQLIKKNKNVIYHFLSLILFVCLFPFFFQFSFGSNENQKSLSVLTYNVNGVYKENSFLYKKNDKKIMEFIKAKDADVLVFQEFWNFGLKHFEEYPYHFLGYREGYTKSLQVILSKYPIQNQEFIDFPNTDNNAMYVDILYKGEMIRIYNLHFESFGVNVNSELVSFQKMKFLLSKINNVQKKRKKQRELITKDLSVFEGKSVVCGDFNSTQFSSTYKKILKGRKDTFIEKGFGLGTTYSLLGYPLRLDYVLPDNEFEVLSHENFKLDFSDHEPVLTRLKLK